MIFTDPQYLLLIFLPFFVYAILRNAGILTNPTFGLAFNVVLGLLYYQLGPGSSPLSLGAYVVLNLAVFAIKPRSYNVYMLVAIANMVALFALKALRPHGAPLGISFEVFQIVGLLVVRAKNPDEEVRPLEYLFFLLLFPVMVAGPIDHWAWMKRFLKHWREGRAHRANFDRAFVYLAAGMMKKVLIADRLYGVVSNLQDNSVHFGFVDSAVFPFLYGIYLYFDFSAYSDIAVGTCLLIPLQLQINFHSPYKARDPISFWRRWHRTLHKFLINDLRPVYRWLGLPRGVWFVVFVFVFSAFWHGVGLGFLLWGLGHLAYFLLYPRKWAARLYEPVAVVMNFAVVCLLWVPFALDVHGITRWAAGWLDLSVALSGQGLFHGSSMNINDVAVVLSGIAIALLAPNSFQLARSRWYWRTRLPLTAGLITAMSLILSGTAPPAPFVYFQF